MVYLFDIKMAMLFFPFVALLITFPVLLWHYHKFGAISRWSILMLYTLVFYLMCAYFLIILPLPSVAAVAKLTTPKYNLQPFMFVRQFIRYSPFELTNIHTWIAAIKSPTVIQPLFNIFLTVPFGFYLRAYFHKSWRQTLAISFCLSLFFELTQLSGDYGIYPRPYRLFDVDDLLLNTTGGMLGFGLTRWVLPLLPSNEHITQRMQIQTKQVSTFRHGTALVADLILVSIVNSVLQVIAGVLNFNHKLTAQPVFLLALVISVLLPQLLFHKTLGMRLVHLQLKNVDRQAPTAGQTVSRWLLGYSLFILPTLIGAALAFVSESSSIYTAGSMIMVVLLTVIALIFGLDLLINLFRPSHSLLFERISHTKLESNY